MPLRITPSVAEQEGQQTETEATGAPQKHHYTLNQQVGSITLKTALSAGQGIEAALIDAPLAVEAQTPLSDLLSHVGHAPCAVPVVDEEQQYIGIISKRMLLQALDREGVNHG